MADFMQYDGVGDEPADWWRVDFVDEADRIGASPALNEPRNLVILAQLLRVCLQG
jgi:hypothetical protein